MHNYRDDKVFTSSQPISSTPSSSNLIDMESLGVLRKDLLDNLTEKEASVLITRYGYSCGTQAALKEQPLHKKNPELTAHEYHVKALEGLGISTYQTKVDLSTGTKVGFGILENSAESQQHLKFFDHSEKPICWFTMGYITGYSAVMFPERKLIYKEVTCIGKGDSECSFVCRPEYEWDDLTSDDNILQSSLQELLHVTLEGFNTAINQSDDIVDAITEGVNQALIHDTDIQEEIDRLAQALNSQVVIEEFGRISYQNSTDEASNTQDFDLSLSSSRMYIHAKDYYKGKRKSFLLTDTINDHEINRIVCPIIINSKKYGHISLIKVDNSFAENDTRTLDKVANAFGFYISRKREVRELASKLKSSFIDDLLTGGYQFSNPALDYGKELDFDLSIESRVAVIKIENPQRPFNSPEIHDWIQALHDVADSVDLDDAKTIVTFRNRQMVILLQDPDSNCNINHAQDLIERIRAAFAHAFTSTTFTAGIGSVCYRKEDYQLSFEAANKVLKIGESLKRENTTLTLEQFGTRTLLYSALDKDVMIDFAMIRLRRLIKHDEETNADLLRTLQTYINNRGNSHKTAEDLHLSSSGLKYRIKSIEEFTGCNLRDSHAFYDLALAIDIYALMKEANLQPN